jgi:hypothetical protein
MDFRKGNHVAAILIEKYPMKYVAGERTPLPVLAFIA